MAILSQIKENAAKRIAQSDGPVIRVDGFPKEISEKLAAEIQEVAQKMGLTPDGKPVKCGENTELRFMEIAKGSVAGK